MGGIVEEEGGGNGKVGESGNWDWYIKLKNVFLIIKNKFILYIILNVLLKIVC